MRELSFTNANGDTIELTGNPYFILSLEGIDTPETQIQTQKAPFQDGETYIDALLNSRTITCEGNIVPGKNLDLIYQYRSDMIRILNPKLGQGVLTVKVNGFEKKIDALPISPRFRSFNYSDMFQGFFVSFYCADPFFKDLTETNIDLSVVSSLFEIPFTFPVTMSLVGDGTAEVTVDGHVPTGFELTIEGPCENPKVTNQDTGEYIKVNATLLFGESLMINTNYGQKSVVWTDGLTTANYFSYLDFTSTFFQFQPGVNTLKIEDDAGFLEGKSTVTFTNKFLGA